MSRSLVSVRKRRADDDRHDRDHDRVPQTVVDVAGRGDHRGRGQRQHAAEPAVADVIRQRHRRVADPGREQLDQERGDRPVHHRHVDHHDDEDQLGHEPVDLALVGAGLVTRRLERVVELLLIPAFDASCRRSS